MLISDVLTPSFQVKVYNLKFSSYSNQVSFRQVSFQDLGTKGQELCSHPTCSLLCQPSRYIDKMSI